MWPGMQLSHAIWRRLAWDFANLEAVRAAERRTALLSDSLASRSAASSATSAPGEGTRIDIRLPLAEKKRAHAA